LQQRHLGHCSPCRDPQCGLDQPRLDQPETHG
jgi:hypothetical protein